MKYLICGAGGFIGGHIAKRLIAEKHEVTCVDVKPMIGSKTKNESKIFH